ncbi:putative ubiquitin conjugating [Phaeomoniella chlamydospora]|uniref:Putative ubiquitin conjugating n=1 Tax=Phaeomoniella chlamydospora TaxID=158046 RepID=A0A0G2E5S5_PHACM|nr:putative ubiquitin conjugating [Phaeomoniella chlamydospora]
MDSRDGGITKFESWDTCSLKSDPSLLGTVERTHLDFNTHEPLGDDLLIVAHTAVEDVVTKRFIRTGIPEKGYVFVVWADESQGRSLIQEWALNLLSRTLTLGDTVKRNAGDAMIGTVTSVSETYALQPICIRTAQGHIKAQECIYKSPLSEVASTQCLLACTHVLPQGVKHHSPHDLLYDISGEELKRADDFEEGDFIVYQNWLGEVVETNLEVVIRLDDGSVVVVDSSNELEIVVTSTRGTIISLPEPDGFKKPDIISWNHGLATIAPEQLRRGQDVVTNSRNIRHGRWISGSYNWQTPRGIVMDVRTRSMDVRWLAPNVRSNINETSKPPALSIRPYENLTTFQNSRDIRPKKGIILYDRGRRPTTSGNAKSGSSIVEGSEAQVGDHVRFRDPMSASSKYKDIFGPHGCFNRLHRDEISGFDMNEFRIVAMTKHVTVRWQDQTVTQDLSTSLVPYMVPDNELCPGEIVALREETQQISSANHVTKDTTFNELQFLQGGYDLRLSKVGVVQSIDASERLAKIRWFSQAKVELLQQGNVLKAGSSLGPISDEIEEVSLYEVMTYPALVRHRRELVLVPGAIEPPREVLNSSLPNPSPSVYVGACSLSHLHPWHLPSILEFVRGTLEPIAKNFSQTYSLKSRIQDLGYGSASQGDDFVGEIVDLGLDGMTTVRMGAMTECREIRLPLHWILMIIDDPLYDTTEDSIASLMDLEDDFMSDMSEAEAIEETVEYEGGHRLDDDSGDEMWSTDESLNTDEDETQHNNQAIEEMDVAQSENAHIIPTMNVSGNTKPNSPGAENSTHITQIFKVSPTIRHAPPQFDILEGSVPSDHAFSSDSHSTASLSRIRKEHKILLSSLPPNVYVRTYEGRLDLLRCLIIGPEDTPYEYAPFVVDIALPSNYPAAPPRAHFHSWTYGIGRVNPNLYEEGKICLSLLGTWHGNKEEQWSEKATILQILVSILGLVLVKNPFFNEAGFESLGSQGEYTTEAKLYTEKVFVMARGFIKHALTRGITGMNDIIAWIYLPDPSPATDLVSKRSSKPTTDPTRPNFLHEAICRAQALLNHASNDDSIADPSVLINGAAEPDGNNAFLNKLSKGAVVMLKKHVSVLERISEEAKENRLSE